MKQAVCGILPPFVPAFRRETAQNRSARLSRYAAVARSCHRSIVAVRCSKCAAALCQHRYPSPRRSVQPKNRPASPFSAAKRALGKIVLELPLWTGDSASIRKHEKGSNKCLKQLGSSQQLAFLHWQAARQTMLNVRLSAQAAAQQSPSQQVATQQQQPLPVLPLAHCVTTSAASAANRIITPKNGPGTSQDGSGLALSGEPRHCGAVFQSVKDTGSCATHSGSQLLHFSGLQPVCPPQRRPLRPHLSTSWVKSWKPSQSPLQLSATTVSAHQPTNVAPFGAQDVQDDRRRGRTPAAVLPLKDC